MNRWKRRRRDEALLDRSARLYLAGNLARQEVGVGLDLSLLTLAAGQEVGVGPDARVEALVSLRNAGASHARSALGHAAVPDLGTLERVGRLVSRGELRRRSAHRRGLVRRNRVGDGVARRRGEALRREWRDTGWRWG